MWLSSPPTKLIQSSLNEFEFSKVHSLNQGLYESNNSFPACLAVACEDLVFERGGPDGRYLKMQNFGWKIAV